MNKGDKIYFRDSDGNIQYDYIKEIVEIDGQILITPEFRDYITLTEDELLDDSVEYVRKDNALHAEKTINLSDARRWLEYHLRDYYEADCWSDFNDKGAVRDFCDAMVNGR